VNHTDAVSDQPGTPGSAQSINDELPTIVAEISFETSSTIAELATIEHSCAWCFETHRVQLVGLLLARNRKRAHLVFRAPDAESVRLASRFLDVPFEHVRLLSEDHYRFATLPPSICE
jgi:hypothetical protein